MIELNITTLWIDLKIWFWTRKLFTAWTLA